MINRQLNWKINLLQIKKKRQSIQQGFCIIITMGSNATTDGVISVSGLDEENSVPLGSAGMGFNWNGITNSMCAS